MKTVKLFLRRQIRRKSAVLDCDGIDFFKALQVDSTERSEATASGSHFQLA